MAQTVNSTVTNFSQQVTDSFSRAKGQVEARTELSSEAKQEVLEHLKQLEVEVGKENKDAGVIQRSWDWVQTNANWIVPTIAPTILEALKKAFHI